MNMKQKTIESLSDMVERSLDEMAAKGELKSRDEVCLLKELLSAHEKLEKEEMYNASYSQDGHPSTDSVSRDRGGNSGRDGWYITREDERYMRNGRYPYNSYGESDVDRIADAVRMAMRNR